MLHVATGCTGNRLRVAAALRVDGHAVLTGYARAGNGFYRRNITAALVMFPLLMLTGNGFHCGSIAAGFVMDMGTKSFGHIAVRSVFVGAGCTLNGEYIATVHMLRMVLAQAAFFRRQHTHREHAHKHYQRKDKAQRLSHIYSLLSIILSNIKNTLFSCVSQ
jgi:hypothetical protein